MSGLKLSEADIERTSSDYLCKVEGWRKLKTDPVSRREWGKGFGEKGMADALYLRYGKPPEVLWIEWKSLHGEVKPHQRDWHTAERARGALTLMAGVDFPASIDGFLNWYRQSGLMRRTL